MFCKFAKVVTLALTVLAVVTTLALAGGQKVSGKIANVDAKQGRITLLSADGNTHALQAPQKLLADLQSGQTVEVEVEGNQVKSINKKP